MPNTFNRVVRSQDVTARINAWSNVREVGLDLGNIDGFVAHNFTPEQAISIATALLIAAEKAGK